MRDTLLAVLNVKDPFDQLMDAATAQLPPVVMVPTAFNHDGVKRYLGRHFLGVNWIAVGLIVAGVGVVIKRVGLS